MRYQEIRSLTLAAILAVAWSKGAAADSSRPIATPLDALVSTAVIVEGSVTAHAYTYDGTAGPRTVATLSDVRVQLGSYRDRTLQVATLGGPITERRWLYIPELPRLTENTRYLVFLTNSAWFYSPIVEEYVFRLEPGPRGGDVLIAPSGHAVTGVSAEGLEFSDDPVVDTQLDFLTPHARLRLLSTDPALLANALSKEDFLAAVRDLARIAPLQGTFRGAPAADRVWDRMSTSEDTSLSTTNGH
jgi:hypothetical protein